MLLCLYVVLIMNTRLQKLLEDYIDLAISHGYSMNRFFSLKEERRTYTVDKHALSCHPLETVVVGTIIKDPINIDIAKRLGMPVQWIDGFLDGYRYIVGIDQDYQKLNPKDPARKRYMEGYKDGQEVAEWIQNLES